MKSTACFAAILWAAFVLSGDALRAAPLNSATVTEIKNDVKIGKDADAERAATVKDTVAGKDRLWTGKKSRAELEFADKSIARLGANTHFSFDPQSRNMKVDRGTALIHVPPGKDGARISSPSATAAIMGDVVAMRVDGKGVTQIVALSKDEQGPIQVTFNKTGETRALQAGEMLTIDPAATRMPEPMTVAVDVFTQTSGLAGGFEKKLPDSARQEIRQTTDLQIREIRNGNLEGGGRGAHRDHPQTLSRGPIRNDVNAIVQRGSVRDTTVQSSTSSGFAGRYVGISKITGPGGPSDNMVLDIRQDGTFRVTLTDTFNGQIRTGSGTFNPDGSFIGHRSDGGTITGTVAIGATTVSGTFTAPNPSPPPPTVDGTFSGSKQ